MHDGCKSLEPQLAAAVEPLCPFDKLAFFQTLYVEPQFRSRTAYLYLCLAMIHLSVELGAQGGLCFTSADGHEHHRLYQKTGGRKVAEVDIHYPEVSVRDAAYYFDLRAICAHPRMPRVLQTSLATTSFRVNS